MSWASYWAGNVYLCTVRFSFGWGSPWALRCRHWAVLSALRSASARQAHRLQRACPPLPRRPPAASPPPQPLWGWLNGPAAQLSETRHYSATQSSLTLATFFHRRPKCNVNIKSGTPSPNSRNTCANSSVRFPTSSLLLKAPCQSSLSSQLWFCPGLGKRVSNCR